MRTGSRETVCVVVEQIAHVLKMSTGLRVRGAMRSRSREAHDAFGSRSDGRMIAFACDTDLGPHAHCMVYGAIAI